jgi:PAS domain S-box-containing protein
MERTRDCLVLDASAFAPRTDRDIVDDRGHVVQFYEDDGFLIDTMSRFAGGGLGAGDAVVVIATRRHREQLERQLRARGLDLATARDAGRYVPLDAAETLSQFMVGGQPDETLFDDVVGGVIARAANGKDSRVLAFGEMVALLWADGKREAAIRLEELWNELAKRLPFSLLCAYPIRTFSRESDGIQFSAICGEHSHVIPAESYPAGSTDDERLRVIAELQRQASVLKAEVTQRQHAEEALRESEKRLAAEVEALNQLHELTAYLSAFPDLRSALQEVLRACITISGTRMGLLQLWNPQTRVLEIVADCGFGQDFLELFRTVRAEDNTACAMALKTGAPIVIEDVGSDPIFEPHCAVAASAGFRAVHSTPFVSSSREVMGVLSLYFPKPHQPSEREQRILDQYTGNAVNLIERLRAEETKARLAAVIECSDDAIITKDLNGVITSWNPSAERIFGYTAEEAIGQPVTMLIPADRVDEEPAILERIRRGERTDHYETVRRRKDGTLLNISLTVSPLVDGHGNVVGASKIARDITSRKRAEAERAQLLAAAERARAEAESATRAKDEFLSVVSHELRTPLASMLGWVAVLKSGVTGERAARALETIERSGRAQAKLIEDLLDASRIITGQMRLDLRLVDLPGIMRGALDTIRPIADAKGVRIEARLDPSAGPVAGDADRLQQIAWNLLSNAVKFTPAGALVEMRLDRRDDDVCLVVRDTGRGISRDFLPFIFERFRQAETAEVRRTTGGLGLGLAIVRHLVELHGGSVAATSDGDGQGATFTVRLPLAPVLADLPSNGRLPRILDGLRVLVVDDNFDAQDSLRIVLESHGARVTVAGSVREARDVLRNASPDVVVSDIRLPDEDGYALVRELRATDRLHLIPAIAVTGYTGDEGARRAVEAGYQVRLTKPVDPKVLVDTVSRVTARSTEASR